MHKSINTAVTLRDVAHDAGVSVNTVSVVLSGNAEKGRIGVATARRVEKVAQRLGYRHNSYARSLRAGKTNLVGIIYQSYPEHHMRRARAAARALEQENIQASMRDVSWQSEHKTSHLHDLLGLRVEGLLLESGISEYSDQQDQQLLAKLVSSQFPIVSFGDTTLPIDKVDSDREQAVYMATTHLLSLGHRAIAYPLQKDNAAPAIQARWRGYCKAHNDWGVEVQEQLTSLPFCGELQHKEAIHSIGYGFQTLPMLMHMCPRPTALLIGNEYSAVGAIYGALNRGVRVPDDLAVVAYSGNAESAEEMSLLPLTRVAFPYEAMGREAVRMLQERMNGVREAPRSFAFAPLMKIGGSCGAASQAEVLMPDGRLRVGLDR